MAFRVEVGQNRARGDGIDGDASALAKLSAVSRDSFCVATSMLLVDVFRRESEQETGMHTSPAHVQVKLSRAALDAAYVEMLTLPLLEFVELMLIMRPPRGICGRTV